MDSVAVRTKKRYAKAVNALEKALALKELPERADRDAVLLRFELAAELMPKVLKRVLSERGANVALPKDIVRAACAAELVSEKDATALLAVIDDRNRMVHDYSEEFAEALSKRVRKSHSQALSHVVEALG